MRRAPTRLIVTLIAAAASGVAVAVPLPARAAQTLPAGAVEWLSREHEPFRRYLAVVLRAVHDYRYQYTPPGMLMPVILDVFRGYLARVHAVEEHAIYPMVEPRMSAQQLRQLALIIHDAREESVAIQDCQRALDESGGRPTDAVISYLERLGYLVKRHLVFHEKHVMPMLETLPAEVQAEGLAKLAAAEPELARARTRYLAWLSYIERELTAISGRVW